VFEHTLYLVFAGYPGRSIAGVWLLFAILGCMEPDWVNSGYSVFPCLKQAFMYVN
jgi:hypothetical protein